MHLWYLLTYHRDSHVERLRNSQLPQICSNSYYYWGLENIEQLPIIQAFLGPFHAQTWGNLTNWFAITPRPISNLASNLELFNSRVTSILYTAGQLAQKMKTTHFLQECTQAHMQNTTLKCQKICSSWRLLAQNGTSDSVQNISPSTLLALTTKCLTAIMYNVDIHVHVQCMKYN